MNTNARITVEDANKLVSSVQVAHRIAVGFYGRVLPMLDEIAGQLGLDFWDWGSEEDRVVPRGSTPPSSRWSWDFVPLYSSLHCYSRESGKNLASPTDVVLGLVLYIDDSFERDGPVRAGSAHQPDPVSLPIGRAVLRTYVYRPRHDVPEDLLTVWNKSAWVHPVGIWEIASEYMMAIGREWTLAEAISNPQAIVEFLKPHCDIDLELQV